MQLYQLILIIVLGILLYNIFDNEPLVKISNDVQKKKPIKKKCEQKYKKKVRFNLEKNNVYVIEKNNKSRKVTSKKVDNESKDIEVPLTNNNLEDIYGDEILNKESRFNIKNIDGYNPQKEMVKRLNEKNQRKISIEKDHSFKNQKSYWDSLNIGDFTDRDFMNIQVNNFNNFRKIKPENGIQISKLYDDLTNGITNPLPLKHNDEDVTNSEASNISGFSNECNNFLINNIEN